MGPKVKHVYKTSLTNNKRSLTVYDKDSSKDNSLLQSLTSSTVRAQQEQVQKMRSDLQERERKILQDITNFNKFPPSKPFKVPEIPEIPKILPDDINERILPAFKEEVPSFIASPIIFKETSFNTEDSFINFENNSKLLEFQQQIIQDLIESPLQAHISTTSSSPNKVPGSSDIPSSEPRSVFDYYETNVNNLNYNNDMIDDWAPNNESEESVAAFASPISDKSISRPSEIETFTIDPEFLASFEGIWQRRLEHSVQVLNPDSPDHFEQIPMISRGAGNKKKKTNIKKH